MYDLNSQSISGNTNDNRKKKWVDRNKLAVIHNFQLPSLKYFYSAKGYNQNCILLVKI